MNISIPFFREKFNLKNAQFELITHYDAMVATVFKVTLANQTLILKILPRKGDFLREIYYLNNLAEKLPLPRIVQYFSESISSPAILMEFIPGKLISEVGLNDKLAYEVGVLLGKIHLNRTSCYGDLTQFEHLTNDPRRAFTMKFEESLEECKDHLPSKLLEKASSYYNKNVDLLINTDGPCIVHRDFRPGNIIVNEDRVKAIIDWSSARSGFAEEDFCLLELEKWSSIYKDSLFSGYTSVKKIPDYSSILPLLCISKSIATIGFTVKQNIWQNKGLKIYRYNLNYLEKFFHDLD